MLKSPYLFAVSVLLTLLSWMIFDTQVKAEETKLALSFDLSPTKTQAVEPPPTAPEPSTSSPSTSSEGISFENTFADADVAPFNKRLNNVPVPAARIPIGSTALPSHKLAYTSLPLPPITSKPTKTELAETESVKGELGDSEHSNSKVSNPQNIGLSFAADEIAIEDRPPTEFETLFSEAGISEAEVSETLVSTDLEQKSGSLDSSTSQISKPEDVQLSFEPAGLGTALDSLETVPNESATDATASDSNADTVSTGESFNTTGLDDWIFQDGSNSLVARTVGSAEGTRHWSGDRTIAYYGHVDPGNGVWNLGTFSYQHGASSPEEADEKQLQRLKRQGSQLKEQAAKLGVELSLEEKLNALDLANQAPLAALDRGGYIERLAQARRLEMTGEEAILWARTYAYLDPDTRAWNAPGLGNNIHSISKDQERRIAAISKALKAFDTTFDTSNEEGNSLESWQRIGLANTAPESPFDSQPPSNLPNLAEAFVLPPVATALVEPALIENISSASVPLANTDAAPTLQALQPTEEQSSETDSLGVAFSPTANLTAIAPVEAQPDDVESASAESASAETAEESVDKVNAPAEIPTAETDIFSLNTDLTDTDVEDANVAQAAHLESQDAVPAQDTNAEEEESTPARQSRLNELIEGVIPRNESDVDIKSTTKTDTTTQDTETTEEHSLWRVESKILPQE